MHNQIEAEFGSGFIMLGWRYKFRAAATSLLFHYANRVPYANRTPSYSSYKEEYIHRYIYIYERERERERGREGGREGGGLANGNPIDSK